MKKAVFIKNLEGFKGDARLYRVLPAMTSVSYEDCGEVVESHDFVIVSAVDVLFSGPETYIFPATEEGKVVRFSEMEGSFRGDLNHHEALARAGYEVVDASLEGPQ